MRSIFLLMITCMGACPSAQAQNQPGMYQEQLIPFCNPAGKWGYKDAGTRQVVIPPAYDNADLFRDGVAEVSVINPLATSFETQLLTGWIDTTGKEIFPPQFTYAADVGKFLNNGILPGYKEVVSQDGKTGVLSLSGKWIMPLGRHHIFFFYDAHHFLADDNTYYDNGKPYPAPKGCLITSVDEAHRLFYVRGENELQNGLCTWEGKWLAPPEFLEVRYLPEARRVLATRVKNGLSIMTVIEKLKDDRDATDQAEILLLDENGKQLATFTAHYTADVITGSTAAYQNNGEMHYFSLADGKPAAPPKKQPLPGGFSIFSNDGYYYGLKNKAGKTVIPPQYLKLGFVTPRFLIAADSSSYLTGVIDAAGKTVIPFEYRSLEYFPGEDIFLAEKNNKYGTIDTRGQTKVPFLYDSYFYFEDNRAEVYANGKHGVIDKAGKAIIPLQYNSIFNTKITDSTSGVFYTVEKNNRWGMFDSSGKMLLPFDYGFVSVRKEDFKYGWVMTEDTTRQRYGLYNIQTGIHLPPAYDIIKVYPGFIITGTRNGNEYYYQLLNSKGKALTGADFTKMDYNGSYLLVQRQRLYGILDTKGKALVAPKYDYLWDKTSHFALVQSGSSYFYVDIRGNEYK